MWSVRNIIDERADFKTMEYKPIPDAPIFPPGLEKVLGYVGTCLKPQFDCHGMKKVSLCEINKILHDILMDQNISIFDGWNTEEVMGKSWLDLHALLHNTCLTIRDKRREDDRFDEKYST